MTKYLVSFLFLFNGYAFGAWSEISYRDQQGNCNRSELQTQQAKFEFGNTAGNCSIVVTSDSDPRGTRYFSFYPNGVLHISEWVDMTEGEARSYWKFQQLRDRGMSEQAALSEVMSSAFHNSATKSYYLLPATNQTRVFQDSSAGLIKIVAPNGREVIFNQATGLIDETQTTDLRVSQNALRHNQDGISITDPNGALITRPYSVGGHNEDKLETKVTVESGGQSCRITASHILQGEMKPISDMGQMNRAIQSNCPGFGASTFELRAQATTIAIADNSQPEDEDENTNEIIILTEDDLKDLETEIPEESAATVTINTEGEAQAETSSEVAEVPLDIEGSTTATGTSAAIEVAEEAVLADPFANSSCKAQINNFFENPENLEMKEEYMKIQGKITLHRIAWTYLKLSSSETDTIEAKIQQLIARRNPALYQEFIDSGTETRNRRLGFAISEMKIFSQQLATTPEDQAYALQYSDVKMMNLLVTAEEEHGRTVASGVMDFTSIIKNSLKDQFENRDANLTKFKEIIDGLTTKKNDFESKLVEYLKTVDCSEVLNATTCAREEVTESSIAKILQSSKDIVDFVYQDDFGKKEELKNIYQWNTYWLHVE